MERLVVRYTLDSEIDRSCDFVLPVKFESKNKFLEIFKNEVVEYFLSYQHHCDAVDKWNKAEPRRSKKASYPSNWRSWFDQKPKMLRSQIFKINGTEFDALHFIVSGNYSPPLVQTIDEWFGE